MLREFSAHQGKLQVPETLAPLLSSLKSCIIFPVVVAGAPPFAMHKVSQAALLTGPQSIACATVLSCLCAWAGVPQTSGKDAFYSKTVFYSNKLGSALLNRIFHPLLQRKMYISKWHVASPNVLEHTMCPYNNSFLPGMFPGTASSPLPMGSPPAMRPLVGRCWAEGMHTHF